ncbi:uncharacterized protein LOC142220534 isoform X2 [Haematobia irritans]|uniref:uncharacterized protein LOC142220534 isoform X2 n=1 Tax=Haematobia irritans TaxID=7368 RepID=UPI003F507400
MKSARRTRQQYGNSERKSNKRSEKSLKLDRKSSRGMVYENEELRLRTININAEVERGQSDIKRLRKENDHLRREIWSLRDEYDRLNKRFKTKFIEADQCNARCSQGGCSCQCPEGGAVCDMGHSKCNSEDSDSCDSCCCQEHNDIVCTDECCNETKNGASLPMEHEEISPTDSSKLTITDCGQVATPPPPPPSIAPAAPLPSILTNFDHLSVVSEETLSNSDVLTVNTENLLGYTPDISGSQTTLPSLVGPLTPLTPIEMVANELNDIQAKVPPLSYFENILQQHMSSNFSSTPGTSSSNSGKTVIRHTNGWDYNIQSPFSQKRYPPNSISPILQQRSAAQTLSTFVPTTTVTPPPSEKTVATKTEMPGPAIISQESAMPVIETVPITTMPINGGNGNNNIKPSIINSNGNVNNNNVSINGNDNGQGKPKHFFAPIKPKLKLNTALANQRRMPPPPPPTVALGANASSSSSGKAPFANGILGNPGPTKCEPPDIYVTNGLATPYKHPVKPSVQPPPIPQRITSNATSTAQVSSSSSLSSLSPSPRQRRKSRQYQSSQNHQHQHHHHPQLQLQQLQHQLHHEQVHQHPHLQYGYCEHIPHYQHQFHGCNCHGTNANNEVYVTATTSGLAELLLTPTNKATGSTSDTTSTTTTLCFLPPAFSHWRNTLTNALHASNIMCNSLDLTITTMATSSAEASILSGFCSSSSSSTGSSALCSLPCLPAGLGSLKFVNPQINVAKANSVGGPVYAIAQNICQNLIIAPAVRQPLMSSIVKCCPSTVVVTPMPTPRVATTIETTKDTVATTTTSASGESTIIVATMASTLPTPMEKTKVTNICIHSSNLNSHASCCVSINSLQDPSEIVVETTSMNCSVGNSVCQTDSANLESILNDIEAISEDILAIQLEKSRSRENLAGKAAKAITKANAPLQQNNKNSKPYRSEMNLLLTYDGDNPTIIQAHPSTNLNKSSTENPGDNGTGRRTRSLERDHTDSPSPNIPDPMQPFPDNRKYIGFDHLNSVAAASMAASTAAITTTVESPRIVVAATGTQTSPVIATPHGHRTHLPLSPLVTNLNIPLQGNGKSIPPTPPARSFPSPLNIKCAGIQRSSSVSYKTNAIQSPTGSPIPCAGVHPNKSHLFSAIANAAAKRAQFRSQPTHMTRSLETDCLLESANENSLTSDKNEKEMAEFVKRKARRVSIVCADTDSPGTPDKPTPTVRTIQSQNSTTASCSDLPTVMQNPALRNFKQPSLSTPSSPHSLRKHEGSPLTTPVQQPQSTAPQPPPTISITPTSPLHQHGRATSSHGNGSPHHHHPHSNSYPNTAMSGAQHQQRKNSQDTIKASAAEIACAAANVVKSKCSRRHSEGTVSHTNQRSSGASGGTNGGHHHGHHNHHHHQHSSSLVSNSNNPHHSHHSHQDSNHETVASCSDRNSNSLASSRESSASFSMRSTRRKLSVSSNTGGKIPWCGCWGNGCL